MVVNGQKSLFCHYGTLLHIPFLKVNLHKKYIENNINIANMK